VSEIQGDSPAVIAVTGLAFEARVAQGRGVRTVIGGGDTRRLAVELERELARGARAIMSFGIAGGLAPSVRCGAWVIASAVVTPNERWLVDAAWARSLAEKLPGAVIADLAGADALILDVPAKRALRSASAAIAVDTESHIAARVAAAHGLPFAAFRVIADPAHRELPAAARVGMRRDGTADGAAVLRSLARAPRQLPALMRTAFDAQTALRALSRGRRRLGAGLGYPNLGELLLDMS